MVGLVIFDKDGTLVTNLKANGPPNSVAEQVPLPGIIEMCEVLRARGNTLAVASNQGGVAMGYVTYQTADLMVSLAAEMIGAAAYELCPYHPEGRIEPWVRDADCRKPAPGMLIRLMERLGFSPSQTLMVGDQDTDRQAAENAGCAFMFASDFFDRAAVWMGIG